MQFWVWSSYMKILIQFSIKLDCKQDYKQEYFTSVKIPLAFHEEFSPCMHVSSLYVSFCLVICFELKNKGDVACGFILVHRDYPHVMWVYCRNFARFCASIKKCKFIHKIIEFELDLVSIHKSYFSLGLYTTSVKKHSKENIYFSAQIHINT